MVDLLQKVKGISLVEKTSKAGNNYHMLQVTFSNGYVWEEFVKNDAAFIISSMK